jgi:hypothetical protein
MQKYKISARNTRIIVNTPDRPDEDSEMAVDVNKPDLACLLSAAPDLLSVLESIVGRTKPAHLFEGITIAPTIQQIQAAQTAIAKAKGEQ